MSDGQSSVARPEASRLSATRGQSEVLGVALLLAITITGTGLVVAFGSSALDDSRQASELDSAEHAMTQFDSRASMVALGESTVQSVSFGQKGGDYSVRPEAGTIEITHVNHDGNGNNETVLPETNLGAVVYENDDTTIAYQGGGVWRKGESGASRMVSPPEFHYQEATLTLPIIRVKGSDSAASSPSGRITEVSTAEPIYPLSDPDDGTSHNNPLENGKMVVSIQSEHYEAWADYFRSRTSSAVTVDHETDPGTVTVNLISTGTTGSFDMPNDGSGVDVRGIAGGHSLESYDVTLRPDDTDSADFSNLQWSMYAEQNDRQFEIHLRSQGGGNDCDDIDVSATVYYSEDGGNTYHGWHDDDAYTTECFDADGDDDDEVRLNAAFVDDSEPQMEYQKLSQKHLTHFSLSGATLKSPASFDEHEDNIAWEGENRTYSAGSTEDVRNVTKHYLALMGPDFELKVDDKNSDTVNEAASTGTLEYGGSGRFITYLHITENEVKVEFS